MIEWIWLDSHIRRYAPNWFLFVISLNAIFHLKILVIMFGRHFINSKLITATCMIIDYWETLQRSTEPPNWILWCSMNDLVLVTMSLPIKKLITRVAFYLELWNWLLPFESFGSIYFIRGIVLRIWLDGRWPISCTNRCTFTTQLSHFD